MNDGYIGIVTIKHPDISEEERERRYQHLCDVVIEETKKSLRRGAFK